MNSQQPTSVSLPAPDRGYRGFLPYDARDPDSKFEAIQPTQPPRGAPNVLIVLLDDVGFGASSAFGGPCATPTAERLAAAGLKYTRFHTTALCAPTRAALLSGRNHHTVGMGTVTEAATAAPGYTSSRPNTTVPLAEILRLAGYSTAQFGKCHEVPAWETSPVGPFDRWPTRSGFDYFYGFVGGETNQWYPAVIEGTTPVEVGRPEDGYHFMADMTDKAIIWSRQQKSLAPDRPFFMYFAPGATHAPHHVPADWIAKQKGRFDQGWDAVRDETFARQKELGVVPAEAVLTERPAEIPAWDDMPAELKPVLARQMEVYAAFLEFADHHVGRLIDSLEADGLLDDTFVYYIIGDNGASAEGSLNGTFNEMTYFNKASALETPEFLIEHLDKFGGPESYNHFAVGWAHAMDTPYQWTKQIASHFGGTRNGTIVHWPIGIKARGGIRHQFHHVIDIASSVLEVVGLPEPDTINGVTQKPFEGTSMRYSFDDEAAPDTHTTQYFEMMGNRGIYHNGWTAVTHHSTPWKADPPVAFDDDVWELYDTTTDWAQAHNLAAEQPDRLHELQRLWLIEAVRHNVLPLDDRTVERMNPDIAGRPELIKGKSQRFFRGMTGLNEHTTINTKNKSHTVTAAISVPESGANGVIFAQGGLGGGWALSVDDGKLTYTYNFLGLSTTHITAPEPLASGDHQVRAQFAYDGGGLGKGAEVTLFEEDSQLTTGHIETTHPIMFSADETAEVGLDAGSQVSDRYSDSGSRFTGDIEWVQIDLGDDSHDHLITPEDRMRVAMAKQ
ncbi:putative arylsulfatase [Arthrobacter globiformis NBRC 12137]|uniref:Putative arylsulfatase n=1 Tax=Arthrobacter globiformis (strain ATCC 8010 / DSM 20124 / JCM 1332 / NBRC 12137 / NCIMB 8907 / NRRL B-2979 / 168) TaxID=1077972 RepID=H0QTR8_ARTG1|nr:arylsulfatase [Arthrobacter globiformis]GAB16219.1 putative arylsulfatase [Arthrobacter globiformis NBRC 12137]